MNRILGFLLGWMALLPLAHGAGFDCAMATSKIEQLICNSSALSRQDEELSQRYQSLIGNPGNEDKAGQIAGQRNWLRQVRNKCASESCLDAAYSSRIKELNALDPLSGSDITCGKMRRFPNMIFAGDVDLGSGSMSPTNVDYRCPESLATQPFLKYIGELAETIRAEESDHPECSGTIIYAMRRYYYFDLARAGFAPKLLKDGARDASTLTYFEQWSWQSPYNHDLHKDFMAAFDQALPLLAEHYRKHFGLSALQADSKARNALMIFVNRASGGFPKSLINEESKLFALAHDDTAGVSELKNEIAVLPPGLASKKQAYAALKVALYGNREPAFISALLDYIGPIDDKLLDAGDESALFAALHNQQYVKLLLDRGEAIDYANSFGKTALFYAIGFNDHDLVKFLLQRGANVNQAYLSARALAQKSEACGLSTYIKHTKRTPLMHAAQNSDVEMIKLLLAHGARLHDVDEINAGVVDYAALGSKLENRMYLQSVMSNN